MGPAGAAATAIYDPSKSAGYVQGQLVYYNGQLYIADTNSPAGIPGTPGSNYTQLTSGPRDDRDVADSFVPTYNPEQAHMYMQGELIIYNGQLYYVTRDAPAGVPGSSEDYFLLSGGGTTSATGPMGPQGQRGATGAQGLRGATGAQGLRGATGATGAQGLPGKQGAPGAPGPTGPTGPQGEKGEQGTPGAAGPQGEQGAQGDPGPQGELGAQGDPGPQGAPGVTGATGPTGPSLGLATGIATGADLFYAKDASGSAVSVVSGGNISFQTNTPDAFSISVATGATGAVVTIDSKLQSLLEKNTELIRQLLVTANYDEEEVATGRYHNGKPIFRRAFDFSVTQGANQQSDVALIPDTGYIDAIVNSGGYWATGNGPEKYAVGGTYVAPNALYAFSYVSTQNQLYFRSNSSLQRDNAPAFVWVDYTKV